MQRNRGRDPDRAVRLVDLDGSDQAANVAAIDWRDYERPMPQVLAMLAASREGAFYDIGANTGFYAVLLGRFALASPVRCFEAVPAIAQICRTNLAANRLGVEPVVMAVGSSIGHAELYLPPDNHGLIETSASLLPDFKDVIARKVTVPITTLDVYNASVGGERVGLIKVDVEGAEDQVLLGAAALTASSRPYFTVELLPRSNWGVIDSFLEQHDYASIPLSSASTFAPARRTSFVPDAHNHLLVPRELLGDTLSRLATLSEDRTVERALEGEDPARAFSIDAEVDRLSYLACRDASRRLRSRLLAGHQLGTSDLGAALEAARRAREELDRVHASTSWRVTRPLRALGRLRRSHR